MDFPRSILTILLFLLLTVFGADGLAAFDGLNQTELESYRQWLQSLEATVEAAGDDAGAVDRPLYPHLPPPPLEAEDDVVLRHIAIARSVAQIEAADTIYDSSSSAGSAFNALVMARNYWHLTEYDSALVWYDRVIERDAAGVFASEYEIEIFSVAVADVDSLHLARGFASLLGADDLLAMEDELRLAYRFAIGTHNLDQMMYLVEACQPYVERMSQNLRYWYVSGLMLLEEYRPALAQLRRLIADGGLSHGLDPQQRAWVLYTIPDIYFMRGEDRSATALYRILAASKLPEVRVWSEYQLAGMDLSGGRFLSARVMYEKLCECGDSGRLQGRACMMAELAKKLDIVKMEGMPYGTAEKYVR